MEFGNLIKIKLIRHAQKVGNLHYITHIIFTSYKTFQNWRTRPLLF